MSLVLDRVVNGPAAHAFVIGVGHYRHLSGGADPKIQTIQNVGILKQLTSPPRSAVAFSDWLISRADNWRVPIATIDLLVSPAQTDPDAGAPGEVFEPATIANIRTAYANWKNRCDQDPDSIAIFFYSGHGVEKGEHFLLAEDFGEQPNNPWLGAFDFDTTRRAFHSTQAATQCFFVDACREITSSMLQQQVMVPPLEIVNLTNSADCLFDLTLKASASNETAHGPPQEPSYFTQAVRAALEGGVAEKSGGKWQVKSGQVSAHIYDVLGLIKEDQNFKQRCTIGMTGSAVLLETPTPNVRLSVTCTPDGANAVADVTCTRLENGQDVPLGNDPLPFDLDLEAGVYQFNADFPGNEFTPAKNVEGHNPPLDTVELECQ